MIDVQNGFKACVGFNMEDVKAILEDICLTKSFYFLNVYHY